MRTASWICTALATVALATPALAQTTPARATPLSGRDGAITEMQRPGPAVPQQNRAGATADAIGETQSGTTEFLKQAQSAVRIGNLGVANELLERAATRMLSRSTVATEAGVPMRDPRLERISAARAALQSRDRAEALRQIDQALTAG